jgi:hypothetical protein
LCKYSYTYYKPYYIGDEKNMNKFEKLIEYVINDEDGKAQDLFHEIVVEKSREIYESLMDEDAVAQDEVDDLIDDVEADEEGVVEGEDEEMEMGDEAEAEVDYDMDGEQDEHEEDHEELEDRVVDLEDKLDELMAEFEELMGGEAEAPAEEPVAMDMEPEMEGMYEAEEEVAEDAEEITEESEELEEAAALKAAPAPVTSEESGVNKKSANADNSGKDGAEAEPVKMGSAEESGRPAPEAKDMGGTTEPDMKEAPKPKS